MAQEGLLIDDQDKTHNFKHYCNIWTVIVFNHMRAIYSTLGVGGSGVGGFWVVCVVFFLGGGGRIKTLPTYKEG